MKNLTEEKTTISVTRNTKEILDNFKIIERETYDSVISRIMQDKIEDELEINEKTKKLLEKRMNNLNKGKVMSAEELIKRLREKRGKLKSG